MKITTRKQAKRFMKDNYPYEVGNFRVSKYYPGDLWWFTFSVKYFEESKQGTLNILLRQKNSIESFHFLKVPFLFFRQNKHRFDVRKNENEFDLRISAKPNSWLICKRSQGISFRQYEQKV